MNTTAILSYKQLVGTFSVLLGLSVLLSGMHAKDLSLLVANASTLDGAPLKKVIADDNSQLTNPGKSPVDTHSHTHIDKLNLKPISQMVSDAPQADTRSLKRTRHHHPKHTIPHPFRGQLFQSLITRIIDIKA